MKGDPIPDPHHVAHLCKPSQIGEDGQPTGAAFELRASEQALSVNWIESLALSNRASEITELRRVYELKLNVPRSARIAILNVGTVKDHVSSEARRSILVLHDPEVQPILDPSHSGFYNLPRERPQSLFVGELIARVVSENEVYPARVR